jgi:hypothetical protein
MTHACLIFADKARRPNIANLHLKYKTRVEVTYNSQPIRSLWYDINYGRKKVLKVETKFLFPPVCLTLSPFPFSPIQPPNREDVPVGGMGGASKV